MRIEFQHPANQIVFGLSSIVAVFFPIFSPSLANRIFCGSIWYLMTACLVYFAFAVGSFWQELSAFFKRDGRRIGICLAMVLGVLACSLFQMTVKPRIFDDEINLALSARSFSESRDPRYAVESFTGNDAAGALRTEWDVRPFLQPYLVSILHSVFGADLKNVLLLNEVILGLILAFTSILFVRSFDTIAAGAISALVATSQPALLLYAASGTFDMLALSMMVLSIFSLRQFLADPSPRTRRLLLASLILLAHSRFESILYAAVTLACLGASKDIRAKLRPSIGEGLFWFTAFLPLVWQRFLKSDSPVLPPGTSLFSLSSALENNRALLESITRVDPLFPFLPPVLMFGALCGFVLFLKKLRRDVAVGSSERLFWLIVVANAVAYWAVITFHFWSRIDDPLVERHYLPLALSLSLCAAWGIVSGLKSNARLLRLALVASLVLSVSGIYRAVERSKYDIGAYAFRFGVMKEFLSGRISKKILLIGGSPRQYIALGYPGVEFSTASVDRERILQGAARRDWDEVYLVQNVSRTRGSVLPTEELKGFDLEVVSEVSYPDLPFLPRSRLVRISRLISN